MTQAGKRHGAGSRWRVFVAASAAVGTLLAGCTGAEVQPGAPSDVTVPSPSDTVNRADGGWTQGLASSVNGPVPVIVVDQFGYRPRDRKIAVLRRPVTGYDSGSEYTPARLEVVDDATGTTERSGVAAQWREGAIDPVSGDRAWWFDFSGLRTPGSYYVRDSASGVRSPTFEVGAAVYAPVLRAALRAFFYQRAGQAKDSSTAGEAWADKASHLGRDQDPAARSWLAKDDASSARDLRGGWYDAGDYNKYTAWHAGYVLGLLQTYVEHPDAVGDDLGIPESGNGVSDLLDEIDWGLSWLVRAQQPDGSVLSIERLDGASPPSAARGPSYYGPPTTQATQRAAAALALAASVYAASGVPALEARAANLTSRAESAWSWSATNPRVTYYNNDEEVQPGSGGLGGGQQETDDSGRVASRLEAAVYLYGATDDPRYRAYVVAQLDAYLPQGSQTQWNVDRQEVLLHFADLPGVSPRVRASIRDGFVHALTELPAFLPSLDSESDPYRAPISQYTWGSNQTKSQAGRMLALATVHGFDKDLATPALAGALDYLHYLHGVNPLGLVYLTTMAGAGAENSARTLYSLWFAPGTKWDEVTGSSPGPAPGFVVGGPNPAYSVAQCCASSSSCGGDDSGLCSGDWSPPRGQPPMKSYLQFNDGWPANSWEVTENSNGYQVAYVRLLAAFVQEPPPSSTRNRQ